MIKPPPGARLQLAHPLAQDLAVACPFLEGEGTLTHEHVADVPLELNVVTGTQLPGKLWISTDFGTAIDFRIHVQLMVSGGNRWLTARTPGPFPLFANSSSLTIATFGKLAEVNMWRHICDISSSDTAGPGGNPWRIGAAVAHEVFGKQMFATAGDTRVYSSVILTKPGVWAHFIYRFVPGQFIDFIYIPVGNDSAQFQRVTTAVGYETTAVPTSIYQTHHIGNRYNGDQSWYNPLNHFYLWRRFLTDEEIRVFIADPYKFFR